MRWTATLAALAAAVGLPAARQPPTPPDPYQRLAPTDLVGQAPSGGPKVCVYEQQKTTKVVYASVCKEYCAPNYSPLAVLRRCLRRGCDGPCTDPLAKTVLVKKSISGPGTWACTLATLPPEK